MYSRQNVKCLFITARSLLSKLKMEELLMYAKEEQLDILGIAETWLLDTVLRV